MPVNIDLENPIWLREEEAKELKKQEQYSNTKEYDGENYIVLGKTFNTSTNAKEGDIIEVRVQELTVSDDELTWAKPQVVGVDKDRDTPYDADQCVRLAKDYEGVLQKSEVSENGKMGETGQKALEQKENEGSQQEFRSDIQERNLQKAKEIEPEEEGGRDLFNVNEGDEGKISVDEHITFLNEEEAKEFKNVNSYENWQNAKDKIGNAGSIHNDVRLHMDDKDYLVGFTPTIGKITDRNKLVDYKGEEKILVPSFKKHTGEGKTDWQDRVGKDKAWVFEPGKPGAPKGQWSVIYKVEPSAKIKFGEVDEHYIEFKITGTKRMPEGRWMLSYVPVGGGSRKWMLSHPEKQEFESKYLNDEDSGGNDGG